MIFVQVLVLIVLAKAYIMERKPHSLVKHEQMCNNVTRDPYFKDEMVVGRVWRIYYAWNMIMGNQCMDVTFKKATNLTILKFRDDMYAYMETMPDWSRATLVMYIEPSREMLLIPDKDFPKIGRFVGVPNIHKGDYLGASEGTVSLYKMAARLVQDGRYLLIGDCVTGVVSLLIRRDQKHTWGEVTSVVNRLDIKFLDKGYPACKFNMRKKRRPKTKD